MARFEDGAASFAIDRFPAMDDDAIERFQIVEIERRRARREDAFAALELDYCGDRGPDCGDAAPAPESAASYLERTSSELLAELKDAAASMSSISPRFCSPGSPFSFRISSHFTDAHTRPWYS